MWTQCKTTWDTISIWKNAISLGLLTNKGNLYGTKLISVPLNRRGMQHETVIGTQQTKRLSQRCGNKSKFLHKWIILTCVLDNPWVGSSYNQHQAKVSVSLEEPLDREQPLEWLSPTEELHSSIHQTCWCRGDPSGTQATSTWPALQANVNKYK